MNINKIIEARLTHNKEALIVTRKWLDKAENESSKETYIDIMMEYRARISELEALKFNIEQEKQNEQ